MNNCEQSLTEVLDNFRRGNVVLLVDDASTEMRGYLTCAAELASADSITMMLNHARGVVCAAVSDERLRALELAPMAEHSGSLSPEFFLSVEARTGTSTGISSADRAVTLRALALLNREDLVSPGHIFPVRTAAGGLLARNKPAEGAVDLATLAGLRPAAAFCLCLDGAGEPLAEPEFARLAASQSIAMASLSQIIRYRLARETLVERIAETHLPTHDAGTFRALCFRSRLDESEHLALIKGELPQDGTPVMVRVQAENYLADLVDASAFLTHSQTRRALHAIDQAGCGIFVYIRHPRRGFLQAQVEQIAANNPNPRPASGLHEYGIGSQILANLGVQRIRLLSSSGTAPAGLAAFNVEIVDQVKL